MSTEPYAIPFNPASYVYLNGDLPEPNKLFSYHLERCAGKSHSCGETALGWNGCLWRSYINPVGARCGLIDGDTIVDWKYTSTPLSQVSQSSQEPSRMAVDPPEEKEEAEDRVELTWKDFVEDSLPEVNRPFHYRLKDCTEPHNTCGIAERTMEDREVIKIPACSIKCPSSIGPSDRYQLFEEWSYLKQ